MTTWVVAGLGLALAVGCGLLIAELLMSPPSGELWELARYFTLAGAATIAGGWVVLQTVDRAIGVSVQVKLFLGTVIAAAVALLNVLIIAQLMFISTDHDLKVLLATVVYSGLVTAFFSVWAASLAVRRLGLVTHAVRRLAAGDLRARAEVAGSDEVTSLARDVNYLAARLQEAERERQALDNERRDLTAAISHDLRTPLSSMRAMVEALDDTVVEGEEVRRYYATMRREIDRLSRMIDDLFELAQLDAGALKLQRKATDVTEIAGEVVDALQAPARKKSISLSLSGERRLIATVDGARIERALANLVRNAIEHTPDGGAVRVDVAPAPGGVHVTVADSGDGIEAADLPHIWERFYRAEKSRNRRDSNGDGAGLGLAIVRGIVEAHGGTVRAESTRGGSVFTVRLPAG